MFRMVCHVMVKGPELNASQTKEFDRRFLRPWLSEMKSKKLGFGKSEVPFHR